MFEHLDRDDHENGSEERFPHPLIGLCPVRLFFRFHDWTSAKINLPGDSS